MLKHSAPAELVAAIRAALDGRTYLTPQLAGEVLESMKQGRDRPPTRSSSLTPRQREILQLVAEGRSAKEIASSLSISARTVEFCKLPDDGDAGPAHERRADPLRHQARSRRARDAVLWSISGPLAP
ncbi:MAG: response regulator transcription factor [Chromatiales bacterium]|nr:response regulator transcription factor [Chromatiales bacterium]